MLDKLSFAISLGGMFAGTFAAVLYVMYIYELRKYRAAISGPHVQHRIAAHEAGHAVAVMAAKGVDSQLKRATIVGTTEYGGQVRFAMEGEPAVLAREMLIVRLAGAAGEYVAREEVHADGCSRDLEEALDMAIDMTLVMGIKVPDPVQPVVDVSTLYPTFDGRGRLGESVQNLLNACMCEAVERIRTYEKPFHKSICILLDRRELSGRQLRRLLEESNAAV
jgi:ATP-dependent Zn protease